MVKIVKGKAWGCPVRSRVIILGWLAFVSAAVAYVPAWAEQIECVLLDGSSVILLRDQCRAQAGLVARTVPEGDVTQSTDAQGPHGVEVETTPGRGEDHSRRESPEYDRRLVENIQALLLALGFDPGPVDGIWGKQTAKSLESFVSEAGLELPITPTVAVRDTLRVALKSGFFAPEQTVRLGSGSGILVSQEGHIVTNSHVVNGCGFVRVRREGGSEFGADVLTVDDRTDLALLRTEELQESSAVLRGDPPVEPGDTIVSVGFPLSSFLADRSHVTVGHVTSLVGPLGDTSLITVSAPIQPGNSGGPILDLSGRVAGVTVAAFGETFREITGRLPQNVNFAIKTSVLVDFLRASDVIYRREVFDKALLPRDVARQAKDFALQVICYGYDNGR